MPALKVFCVPASLYTPEGSKMLIRLQAESCYVSFSLPVPSRNEISASLCFIVDLKHGTITTTMMVMTNMLTLQLIFETYCMPSTCFVFIINPYYNPMSNMSFSHLTKNLKFSTTGISLIK